MKQYNYQLNKDGYVSLYWSPVDTSQPFFTIDDDYVINDFTRIGKDGNVYQDKLNESIMIERRKEAEVIYNKIKDLNATILELEEWFKYYDNQIIQYERHKRLGIEFNHDINVLDNEAIDKASRLKQTRIEVGKLTV